MSITETNVGISSKLHEVYECFTRVSKGHKGPLRVILVLTEELESDPVFWTMMADRYHLLQVNSMERASEALEWYCMNYSFAANSVLPGVPTVKLEQYRENHD